METGTAATSAQDSPAERGRVRAGRVAYLDGIRGIAIAAVLAVHWLSPYAHGLFRGGYIGVDLFLVLSGFVITSILWRGNDPYGHFLWKRVKRLYPALLGAIVVGVGLVALFGSPVPAMTAVRNGLLSLTQSSSILAAFDWVNLDPFGHTWSLSVEWIFYLVWPLLLAWGKMLRLTSIRLAYLSLACALVAYVSSLFLSADGFYYGPLSRSAQLLVGGALALWTIGGGVQRIKGSARTLPLVVACMAAATAAYAIVGPYYDIPVYRYLGFPFVTMTGVGLVLVGQLESRSALVKLLEVPPLTFLGRVSYSLYLWHVIGLRVLSAQHLHLSRGVAGLLVVALTSASVWASYRWLEKPFIASRRAALLPSKLT